MDNTANGYGDFDHRDLGDENPESADLEEESDDENPLDISEPSHPTKHQIRSMNRRQHKRTNSKPTRPSTYMGQRGNRRNRRAQ